MTKKNHCLIARIRRAAKISLENLNQNLPEDQQINSNGLLLIAMVWALFGVMLVNSNSTTIPWLQPLGWVTMIMGALSMVASLLLSMDEK
ncbi:hypothetical protein SAMN02982919_02333 [Giesbergeria anulus]|uniref:Uncharacterized protein n=1 Tax=Giesbergeria anulus TaxID=180197 RepID=A0A1H9NTV8_9BURK|nr:hypothetical protein SAMN02982919_02333 [Giesbergeria anulus]